jgi:hypothetical protein
VLRPRLAPFVAVAVVLGLACGTASLLGSGESCFVATDCQPGLACVPQANGSRICSADLTNVVFVPDAAEAAPPPEGGPDATSDGPKPDVTMNPDTSMAPDTSMTPDTSMGPDTSMPDAGAG